MRGSQRFNLPSLWAPDRSPRASKLEDATSRWAQVVGGILQTAGIDGFLENLDEVRALSDAEFSEWRAFAKWWWSAEQAKPVLVGKIAPTAKALMPTVMGGHGMHTQTVRSTETTLAYLLGRHRGRRFQLDGFQVVITQAPASIKTDKGLRDGWRLMVVETTPGSDGKIKDDSGTTATAYVGAGVGDPLAPIPPQTSEPIGLGAVPTHGHAPLGDTPPNPNTSLPPVKLPWGAVEVPLVEAFTWACEEEEEA